MPQHIGIKKIDEEDNEIEAIDVNFAEVVNLLWKKPNFQKEYPWLSTIDPYGDTIINRAQAPVILEELKKLQKSIQDDELNSKIEEIKNFLSKIDLNYIKFIGD